jgi:ABC-2 type transport system permease protein
MLPLRSLSRPAWRSHLRALWAVAVKDWKEFWRYPLNAAARAFEPLVWLTPVYFLGRTFSGGGQAAGFAAYSGTADYMSFILLGTVLVNFTSAVFWGMGFALKYDMDAGVLESNWLAPVPRLLLVLGRTGTSLLTTAITSTVMLCLASVLFGFRPGGNFLAAALIALPMLLGLYGFGFGFAALVLLMRDANALVDISNFLVYTFAGSNFPVQALPRWLLPVSLALPLTYGLDAVRGLLLGTRTLLPLGLELALLLVFMALALFLGAGAFAAVERRVRAAGTLSQH